MSSALGVEPNFTNYTANFKGCLDYIWYSPGRIRVMAVSGMPEENFILQECGEGLPAANFPSDHIMLCCDVALSLPGTSTGIYCNPFSFINLFN